MPSLGSIQSFEVGSGINHFRSFSFLLCKRGFSFPFSTLCEGLSFPCFSLFLSCASGFLPPARPLEWAFPFPPLCEWPVFTLYSMGIASAPSFSLWAGSFPYGSEDCSSYIALQAAKASVTHCSAWSGQRPTVWCHREAPWLLPSLQRLFPGWVCGSGIVKVSAFYATASGNSKNFLWISGWETLA